MRIFYGEIQIRKLLFKGGGMCPEQYNVFLDGKEVAYVRLRHGYLSVQVPFGTVVAVWEDTMGDGCFDDIERMPFLNRCAEKINEALNPTP